MPGIPYKYAETFARLQRATEQLHSIMTSGEFYTYGYVKRRKLLRRVRRLYNRLAGPVSPAILGSAVAAAGVLTLAGCFPPTDPPPEGNAPQVPLFGTYLVNPFGLDNVGVESPLGAGPVVMADVDGDSDLDMLYSGIYAYSEGSISRSLDRENTGGAPIPAFSVDYLDRLLAADYYYPVFPYYGWNNMRVLAGADVDGDGDVDLIAAGYSYYAEGSFGNFVHIIENEGTPSSASFADPVPVHPDAGYYYDARAASLVDLDGDGDLDLVYLDSGSGYDPYTESGSYEAQLVVLENLRNGSQTIDFAAPVRQPVTLPAIASVFVDHFVFGAALTDLDADGDVDLLVSAYSFSDFEPHLHYFENQGSGSFAAPLTDPFGIELPSLDGYAAYSSNFGLPITAADFDTDGDVDLLYGPVLQYAESGATSDFFYFENQAIP